jgi:uncharacterized DUF497 family protein
MYKFDWDVDNRMRLKDGLSEQDAEEVATDEHRRKGWKEGSSGGSGYVMVIGSTEEERIVYLTHVRKGPRLIRILMAREASKKEKELYKERRYGR